MCPLQLRDGLNILMFLAWSHGAEQHKKSQEGNLIFQPSARSWEPNHNEAPEVTFHQEQLPLPQGQDSEGGDHQAHLQWRGNRD